MYHCSFPIKGGKARPVIQKTLKMPTALGHTRGSLILDKTPELQVLEKDSKDSVYDVFHQLGVLRALGLIFKNGKREEMLSFSQTVLPRLVACGITSSSDTAIRKLAMKVIQRIGELHIFCFNQLDHLGSGQL